MPRSRKNYIQALDSARNANTVHIKNGLSEMDERGKAADTVSEKLIK